jgi:hypothetical protein
MKLSIALCIFLVITIGSFAQQNDSVREVPFQITFVPPMGTNGIYAGNTVNRFSINITAGYAYGLKGVEFGSIANVNSDFMHGVQFSGFANITNGEATGVQFAGFSNMNNGNAEVLQFAGFANINNGMTNGFQAAGFGNFALDVKGAQIAGFGNLGSGNIDGVQISGFGNLGSGNVDGVQIAGFGNFGSGNIDGLQIAGFGNFSSGNTDGAQIAGFGNFALNVKGAQIAGFMNVSKTLTGLQLGVLNIADTVKNGIPIGVLSIVRNGYREFEIGISEGLNSYASFKIGVKQFYNLFSVGIQYLSDRFRWGFGYGIGTHLADSENFKVNLEAMSYHINENTYQTNAYNDIQQLKLTFARTLSDNLSLFAGPTLNLMISDYLNPGQLRTGSCFAPYTIINEWSNKTSLKGWAGFSAGIRIR